MKTLLILERLKSFILDLIIVAILNIILSHIIESNDNIIKNVNILDRSWKIEINQFNIIMFLYFLLFDFISNSITLGKKIFGLTVVFKKNKTSVRVLRTILKLISILIFPILIINYFINDTIVYDEIIKSEIKKTNLKNEL